VTVPENKKEFVETEKEMEKDTFSEHLPDKMELENVGNIDAHDVGNDETEEIPQVKK